MKHKKGFTLLEMLIVLAVLGILATIVVAALSGARRKANISTFISEVASAQQTWMALCYSEDISDDPADTDSVDWANTVPSDCGLLGDNVFEFSATAKRVPGCSAVVDQDGVQYSGCSAE